MNAAEIRQVRVQMFCRLLKYAAKDIAELLELQESDIHIVVTYRTPALPLQPQQIIVKFTDAE